MRVPPPFSGPVLLSELVDRARSCTLKLPFFFSLRDENEYFETQNNIFRRKDVFSI